MKVYDCLSNIDAPLGYVHIISYTPGGVGIDKTLDGFSSKELVELLQKESAIYYQIGSYWYVIYQP